MSGASDRSNKPSVDYDLTCWYLNARRVLELVGNNAVAPYIRSIDGIAQVDNNLRKNWIISGLKSALTDWLHNVKPPTLGQLLIGERLQTNVLFTHYTNYFFRGLSEVHKAIENGRSPIPSAEAYAKLEEFSTDKRVRFRFHHEHLTSNSSWAELRGQKRLLILGMATEITDQSIDCIPWVIANPMPHLFDPHTVIGAGWMNRLETFVDMLDCFSALSDYRPRFNRTDLNRLKDVREAEIKRTFAELINEPTVPKDWGGEQSDLFTTQTRVRGERLSAAFAFKGPAKFHPMTMADLGKNGDQINRLFAEPADLLVLQHCHEITPPVRGAMRAFAQQMGQPRLFCLIDGYETMRILEFFGKCGFSKRNKF